MAWTAIIFNSSPAGMRPANAIGKKMRESALSPARVETTARNEKCFPLDLTFIRLITYAFRKEPARKATRLAPAILGAIPNTKLKNRNFLIGKIQKNHWDFSITTWIAFGFMALTFLRRCRGRVFGYQ